MIKDIKEFEITIKCKNCGSTNVYISVTAGDGFSADISIKCEDCGQEFNV